jgi:hypothetical protein
MSGTTTGAAGATGAGGLTGQEGSSLDELTARYQQAQQFEMAVTMVKLQGDCQVDAAKQRPQV